MSHPECPSCGSDQVLCDAYAYWNHAKQEWELHSTYDGNFFCSECESDLNNVNWVEDDNED